MFPSLTGFTQLPAKAMSIRSYTRSTDCNCESRGQDITTSVDISLVSSSTFRTFPLFDTQRQLIDYKTAVSTSFTRRKPSVNFYQFSTIPLALIFKLSNQLTPSSIGKAAGQGTVFNHVSDSQILNKDRLVFAYQLSRQLVQKIFSRIGNFSLNSGYSNSCFFSILRAFFSKRKSFLKNMCRGLKLFVSVALRRGCLRNLLPQFKRPVHARLTPSPPTANFDGYSGGLLGV